MSNYIQLQNQIQKLQKEALAARKREITETIANIKKAIAAFGLTAEDLGLAGAKSAKPGRKAGVKGGAKPGKKGRGRPAKAAGDAPVAAKAKRGRKAKKSGKVRAAKGGADKRSVVAPKYRDSATGATWTGRGKQPRWLADAIAGGKKIEDFKI